MYIVTKDEKPNMRSREFNIVTFDLTYGEILQLSDSLGITAGALQEMWEDPHYNGSRTDLQAQIDNVDHMIEQLEAATQLFEEVH